MGVLYGCCCPLLFYNTALNYKALLDLVKGAVVIITAGGEGQEKRKYQ